MLIPISAGWTVVFIQLNGFDVNIKINHWHIEYVRLHEQEKRQYMKQLIFSLSILIICSLGASSQIKPAPAGFDLFKVDVPHGKIGTINYGSKAVGTKRKALIYTPPGFKKNKKYAVLYLLHGIGGDEKEWLNGGHPEVILDNLYSANEIEPMIVGLK